MDRHFITIVIEIIKNKPKYCVKHCFNEVKTNEYMNIMKENNKSLTIKVKINMHVFHVRRLLLKLMFTDFKITGV